MTLPVRPSLLNPGLLFRAAPLLPLQPAASSLLLAEVLPAMVTLPRRDANGQVPQAAQRYRHTITLGRGVVYDVEIEAPSTVGRPTAGSWDFLLALEGLVVEGRFDLETGLLCGKPLSEYEWLRRAGRAVGATAFRQLRGELRRIQKTTVTITNRSTVAALARAQELGTSHFGGRLVLDRGEWILSYGRSVDLDTVERPQILHDLRFNPLWLQSMGRGLTYFLDSELYCSLRSFAAKRLLQVIAVEIARDRLNASGPWLVDEATLAEHLGLAGVPLFQVRPQLTEALRELVASGGIQCVEERAGTGGGRGARVGGRLLAITPAVTNAANGLLRGVTLDELQDREWLLLFAHLRAMGLHASQAREALEALPRLRVRHALQLMFWEDSRGSAPRKSWGARLLHALEHSALCDDPTFRRWQETMVVTEEPRLRPQTMPAIYIAPAEASVPAVSSDDQQTAVITNVPEWVSEILEAASVPSMARQILRTVAWSRDESTVYITGTAVAALLDEHRRAVEAAAALPIVWTGTAQS